MSSDILKLAAAYVGQYPVRTLEESRDLVDLIAEAVEMGKLSASGGAVAQQKLLKLPGA